MSDVIDRKQIRAGVVGSGFGLRVVTPCLNTTGKINVVALVSREPHAVEAQAKSVGIGCVVSSLEAMLNEIDVDLVYIALPPFLHYKSVIDSLEAGKHVLCEKPFGLTAEESRDMYEAARGSGLVHKVGYQMRFQPNRMKIKRVLSEGRIGKLHHVEVSYQTATRLNSNIPLWHWWFDKHQGGGQLLALGSHQIDTLRWWFGEVKTVHGTLRTYTKERPCPDIKRKKYVSADEAAMFQLEFENDLVASVIVSSVAKDEPMSRIRIVGSNGSLVLDGDEKLLLFKGPDEVEDISEHDPLLGEPVIGLNPWRTSMVRFGEHIATCIQNHVVTEGPNFYDGLHNHRVLDAIRESHQVNRSIMLN